MKYINIKRYKFSTILKNFKTLGSNVAKLFKFIDIQKYDLKKFFRYLNIIRYLNIKSLNLTKITKYLNIKTYNISRLKRVKFTSSKFLLFHLPASIIFFVTVENLYLLKLMYFIYFS